MFTSLLSLAPTALAAPLQPLTPDDVPRWDTGAPIDYIDQTEVGPDHEPVVGGKPVKEGKWDDTVGVVFYNSYVGCTGTLVAKNVVLTAGHCVGGITQVIVGSKNWIAPGGELIDVDQTTEYPNSQGTYDIAVLKLDEKSSYEPRAVAIECILDDYLEDGAKVQIVGFGMTNETGTDYSNTTLMEAGSTVADADCSETYINGIYAGCMPSVNPGGEIAAGGDGTDACYGDSGGPLYLKTDVGDYLVGVTSRALLGVNPRYPCRDGGIWVRPDAVIDWIEDVAGRKIAYPDCNLPPEVSAEPIVATVDGEGSTVIVVVDPEGKEDKATFEVVVEPEHGSLDLHDDGTVDYFPDAGYLGDDAFVVAITDGDIKKYERTGAPDTVELEITVTVEEGSGDGLFGGEGSLNGCGCASGGGPGTGAALLGLLGLLGLRRRR